MGGYWVLRKYFLVLQCMFFRAILVVLCTITFSFSAQAANTVVIDASRDTFDLGIHIEYLVDESANLTFEDVLSARYAESFTQNEEKIPFFGFSDAAFWLRFTLLDGGGTDKKWMLHLPYPLLDHVSVYLPDDSGRYTETMLGRSSARSTEGSLHKGFFMPIGIRNASTMTVYLRVESEDVVDVPLYLRTEKSLYQAYLEEEKYFSLYFGLILSMFVFNLLLLLVLKDVAYLYYLMILVTKLFLLTLSLNGLISVYFDVHSLWMTRDSNAFFGALSILSTLLFTREFLKIKTKLPSVDRVLVAMSAVFALLSIASFFVPYFIMIALVNLLTLPAVMLGFVAGVMRIRQGDELSKYYMVALGCFFVGIFIFCLRNMELIPNNVYTNYLWMVGGGLESVLLSVALAARFSIERKEKENAQRDALNSRSSAVTHLKKYQEIYENSTDGLFQLNLDGSIIDANHSFVKLVGIGSLPLLKEKTLFPFRSDCFLQDTKDTLSDVIDERKSLVEFDANIILPHGESRWISLSIHVVKDNSGLNRCFEGKVIDVTEAKKLEFTQKEKCMTEAADYAKDLFLDNMRYEMLTPVDDIVSVSGVAISENNDKKIGDYLRKIMSSSRGLKGVVANILDLSNIEAGRFKLESSVFNCSDLVQNLLAVLSFNAEDKGVVLNVFLDQDIPDILVGDCQRIEQVFINLVNNAIQHTAIGQIDVCINLRTLNKVDRTVVLLCSVQDTRIDIAEARARDSFSGGDQADKDSSGWDDSAGLGLGISQQLVELMGGEVLINNEERGRNAVEFTLKCMLQNGSENNVDKL